jgi:iron complex transport system substrate-binding protein
MDTARPRPVSRRQLLATAAGIGTALLAAACSDDEATDPPAATGQPSSTEPESASSSSGTGGTSSATTRTVTDEFGPVDVPVEPQRVVFMDTTTFGNALALGFPVDRIVGVGFADVDRSAWSYLESYTPLAPFADSGDINNPNIEQVAALNPDLIVQLSLFDEQRAQLIEIGPPLYVALNGYGSVDEMMELLRDCGDVLGLSERAAELETTFRARVETIVAKFAGERPAVTAIRVFDEADIWTQAHPLFDLMQLPRQSPPPPELFEQLSPERLVDADADLLWVSGSAGIDASREALESNPLWPSLNAVQTGMVRYVEDQPWGTDYSYPALLLILDEIEAGLDAFLATR